jgi:outer membrane protein assembly factor BamB
VLGLVVGAALLVGSGCTTGRFSETSSWASPLQIDDTTVVLGTRNGEIIAVSIADGSELWKKETESGRNIQAVFGSPVSDGDLVYAGGFDGVLYAIRLHDDSTTGALAGDEAWTFMGEKPFIGGPVLAGDLVIIGSEDGTLYAIEAPDGGGATGKIRWTFSAEGQIWSTPAITGGMALVGTLDGVLHAVGIEDDFALGTKAGEERWKFNADAGIAVRPVINGDTAYFGSFDSQFYAVDTDNGLPRWLEPFEANNWIWAEPLFHEGKLYVPSLDHNLYVLDASSGAELLDRRLETGGAIRATPALVAGNVVLIANEAEETWWIDTTTGAPRAGVALTSPVYAPLLSLGPTALIYAQNGRLYRVAPNARQPVQLYPLEN